MPSVRVPLGPLWKFALGRASLPHITACAQWGLCFFLHPHLLPGQVRERLRAALERVATLEEQLAGAHQQVSACSPPSVPGLEAKAGSPFAPRLLEMLTAVSLSWLETAGRREAGTQEGLEHRRASLVSDSLCWDCALQVSALQQGAGLRDGVAEEEGTVELGLKRLWKVGYGSCIAGACLPPDRRRGPGLFSGAAAQSISGLLPISPSLFSFHTPSAEKSIVVFPCPLPGT